MNITIPKEHWAEDKVRKFAPVCKEKSTLIAIAGHANPQGYGSIVCYETIGKETGHSPRTVRRHVKTLVETGQLVCWQDLDRRGRSNSFFIPIAAETIEELEARTGVSRKQLKLPLVQRDRGGAKYVPDALKCPTGTDVMSHPQGQTDPQTLFKHGFNKEREGFSLKTKKEKDMERSKRMSVEPVEDVTISPDTEALIRETIEKLKSTADQPVGTGSIVKRTIWGDTPDEERRRLLDLAKHGHEQSV